MRNEERKAHVVGSGIANLAAAAYLIKDGGFSGANISIYEEESLPGGAFDAAGTSERGYFMRGERMFEANYVCMCDLLSFIPSLDDPAKTIKQDTLEFTAASPWNNKAHLVANGKILNFTGHIDESKQEAGKNGITSLLFLSILDHSVTRVFPTYCTRVSNDIHGVWNAAKALGAVEQQPGASYEQITAPPRAGTRNSLLGNGPRLRDGHCLCDVSVCAGASTASAHYRPGHSSAEPTDAPVGGHK